MNLFNSSKMRKLIVWVIFFAAFGTVNAASKYSPFKGVWSSDSAEAVITDSICIFYYHADSTMQAILEIPAEKYSRKTVFMPDGTVNTSSDVQPLSITEKDNVLSICGYPMRKVEEIKIVKPYDMPQCTSKLDVGRCLQQWRLWAGYGISGDMVYCEINTNRHMFVYMENPTMVYIRAAAARNNNHGTLFFQNIRMMKNRNTNEFTMSIAPDNFNFTRNDLEIDNTKFRPNSCTFDPDGGIYWSLISFEPNLILLNGCGETYRVERPAPAPDREWIEYVPYSENDMF